MPISTSVIISTYNWKEALALSIKSLWKQTVLPAEIIVADDGSGPDTKALVAALAQQSPVPLHHCWHPDTGFRLAAIRNKAIAQASGDYILQIDGDIICDPHFVADHLFFAEEGYFVCGRRLSLTPEDTQQTLAQKQLLLSEQSMKRNKAPNRTRSPLLMRLIRPDKTNKFVNKGLLGCNMSYWRKDALAVNGYNTKIEGWGKEDDEFTIRLQNWGLKKRSLRFGGIACHLYHNERSRDDFDRNSGLLREAIEKKTVQTLNGIQEL